MWLFFFSAACSDPPPPPAAPAPPPSAPPAAEAPVDEATEEKPAPTPQNRPPVVDQVTLTPTEVRAGDTVRAVATAHDPEGAEVSLDYTWFVDDARVPDAFGDRFPSGRLTKGQRVRVRVTAGDGTDSTDQDSDSLVVQNTAPSFLTGPHEMKGVDGFTFRAEDPDGDPLTWKLEGAPPGMQISSSGRLSYRGTEDEPGGDYKVAVLVDDGEAWGRYEFPLAVSPGSKAKKAEK